MKRWDVERAVMGSDLPPPARHLMLTLAVYTADGGTIIPAKFTPSLNTLVAATGLSRRTVMTHLDNLDRDGWLIRQKPDKAAQLSQRARTRYRLSIPTGAGAAPVTPSSGAGAAPVVGQEMHQTTAPTGAGVAPNQNKNTRTSQTSARVADPLANLGMTDDERRALIKRITDLNPTIRNPSAYLATLASNGDLGAHLEAMRAEHRKAQATAQRRACRRCDADGYLLMPGSRSLRVSPYQTCQHANQLRTA